MTKLEQQSAGMAARFAAACTAEDAPLPLGLAVEQFAVHDNGRPAGLEELQQILRGLQRPGDTAQGTAAVYTGFAGPVFALILGAGGQITIGVAPRAELSEVLTVYKAVRQQLSAGCKARGLRLCAAGCHPSCRAAELPLLPLDRCRILDAWLKNTGRHGVHMMRAAAGARVTIGYSSEQDFVRKYRAACLLSPLLALLTDNAPAFEGRPNRIYSVRTAIRGDADPARCGVPDCLFAPDFGFAAYARYVLQKPLVVLHRNGADQPCGQGTAEQLYGPELTDAQIAHILSMFYYDVRLQNGLVLDLADSIPAVFLEAYAQLIRTVFGSPVLLVSILQRYRGVSVQDIQNAKMAVCANGYAAQVYGRPVAGELAWLLTMAKSRGVKQEGRERLEPLSKLAAAKTTLREVSLHA